MSDLLFPYAATGAEPILAATRQWLERAVIGLNLCPFAKSVFVKKQVRYALTAAATADELLAELEQELALLAATEAEQLDTTLLIHPLAMTEFLDYHFFLAEAEALILNKYTSMPVGRALMVSDLGIVLVGAYLYGPATGLYCILGMILKSTVADSAIESINLRKVCTVVTSNPQPVRDFIVNDLHRSATMEQAEGAYTHDEKWVLTTVLTRGQAQKLRLHVRGLDDHAFITIVNSSEIVGKGFRAI